MTKESTTHNQHERQVRQENLLLFCGMAFMAVGPVFWYLAGMALDARAISLEPDKVDVLEWVSIAVSLLLSLSGVALSLAGWGLASWHAWRAVRHPGGM
ncbi:MAG: hypothetical protein ACRCZ6_13400 [Kluyvera sp.]|uniref:hypothetical protein n=1 Tax=Kluyvera sp. TaxID=1538228 RepID=UPI003F2AA470